MKCPSLLSFSPTVPACSASSVETPLYDCHFMIYARQYEHCLQLFMLTSISSAPFLGMQRTPHIGPLTSIERRTVPSVSDTIALHKFCIIV